MSEATQTPNNFVPLSEITEKDVAILLRAEDDGSATVCLSGDPSNANPLTLLAIAAMEIVAENREELQRRVDAQVDKYSKMGDDGGAGEDASE